MVLLLLQVDIITRRTLRTNPVCKIISLFLLGLTGPMIRHANSLMCIESLRHIARSIVKYGFDQMVLFGVRVELCFENFHDNIKFVKDSEKIKNKDVVFGI